MTPQDPLGPTQMRLFLVTQQQELAAAQAADGLDAAVPATGTPQELAAAVQAHLRAHPQLAAQLALRVAAVLERAGDQVLADPDHVLDYTRLPTCLAACDAYRHIAETLVGDTPMLLEQGFTEAAWWNAQNALYCAQQYVETLLAWIDAPVPAGA